MERTLSKVGKVWSLIKRDGLWRALERTFGFFVSSFNRVGAGQILYINGGIGDSALYRGPHVVEELNAHGFIAARTVQDNPFLLRYIDRFDVFILHRVNCTKRLTKFIDRAKAAGKTVLFDTDDLTFDSALMEKTEAYANMNTLERAQYKNQSACVVNDPYVAYATTTTEPLAEHLRKKGKKVFVVPNKISKYFVSIADNLKREMSKEKDPNTFIIGYFSGTATHARDFAVVTDALLKVFEEYDHVYLFIAGPLMLDARFDVFKERIIRQPYVSREEHFANVASCDVNIAPLEVGDEYCEAKSAIKYYEAGVVSVPTIASATQVFAETIRDGVTGFVAKDTDAWYESMQRLIEDRDLLATMSQAAHDDVHANHTTTTLGNEAYYAFLRQKIDGSESENLDPLMRGTEEIDTVVVIVTWNLKERLETCLLSLRAQKDKSFRTIVVDNGSADGTCDMLHASFPEVSWIALTRNFGFAHPSNCGIRAALTRASVQYVITLNNDTEPDFDYVGALRRKIQQVERHGVGALQPKVLSIDDHTTLDATGVVTSFEMSALNRGRGEADEGQYDRDRDVFGPSASAALYTRERA